MTRQAVDTIREILPSQWQRLNTSTMPCLDIEFFSALERSGCVGEGTGWMPHHVVFSEGDEVVGILPSYIKTHSWGEFVFDWDWAQAFERHGLPYYPKLVSTIPFTPITTDKLLSDKLDHGDIVDGMVEHCLAQSLNSWHLLFCPKIAVTREDVFERHTVQFHWFNRDYRDFEHFLSYFTARKRKSVRKERVSIAEQNIDIRRLGGADISAQELEFFYRCYQQSYFKRDHTPHLSQTFFAELFARLADNILLIIASHQQTDIACALFFFDEQALYGRYWGCVEEFNNLHFELCYYQGIDFCIANNLSLFNPGAQGEHKIKRGFEPVLTYSYHWVKEEAFRPAIKDFCQRERQHLQQYFIACQQALPFKQQD